LISVDCKYRFLFALNRRAIFLVVNLYG
jgi:hypothetical protein